MAVVTKKTIDGFYAKKRIAVIGASRSDKKYGRHLFEELRAKGYDVVPVNPNADEIGGVKAYKSIKDVKPGVEGVIAVVPPSEQEKVVKETAAAGVKSIWLHEHVMKGVSNPAAIGLAAQLGLETIAGFCPFMFMPGTAPFHKFHGMIMKFFGAYPK
jgi:predicted CoA-binding protein